MPTLLLIHAGATVAAAGGAADVARGRYLAEQVAMCGECHTPRLEDGALDRSRWLAGAPVPVQAPSFVRSWAIRAPRISGLGAYSDDEALRLLTTGIARDGRPLRPPMPQFRFDPEDARAVVAYLRAQR